MSESNNSNALPNLGPKSWRKDRRFYDDTVFPHMPNEKGYSARRRAVRQAVRILHHSHNEDAFNLSGDLDNCQEGFADGYRCHGGACLICRTARSRSFLLTTGKMFDLTTLSLSTIAPTEIKSQPVSLRDVPIKTLHKDFAEKLSAAGLSGLPVAAGLDFLYGWSMFAVEADRWFPHWHAIVSADHAQEIADRLTPLYEPTSWVRTPVTVKPIVKWPARAVASCFATEFYDRAVDIHHDFDGEKYKRRIVPGLWAWEDLLVGLDRIGLDNRVFIQGAH